MAGKLRNVNLPKMQMRAEIGPQSINKDQRTVDIIWTTGKKGLRSTWDGSYYEELSLDPSHVRMGRLESGNTPLLNNHDRWSGNEAVIGVVEKAAIQDGIGTATVRFADTADVADIWRKIETGILKNISVGYSVYRYERQPDAEGEDVPTYLATDWEPTELSVVPVGFDENSVVRSREESAKPCVFVNNIPEKNEERTQEVHSMTDQEKLELEKKRAAEQAELEKKAAEKARALEKTRQSEIRKMVSGVKLSAEFAAKLIDGDVSIDESRALIIEELARKSDEKPAINANSRITEGTANQSQERKLGLENAMLHRANPGKITLTDAGREFRGMTLLEMARDSLNASGISTRGMSKMDLATRAFNSSSDFPNVLANVANKSLRKGYDEAPRTFLSWAKQAQVADFKQVSRTQLGEAPNLEVVGEDGEIKKGTIGDGAEKYSLATYAKMIGISRKVIINDDLNAFTNMPQKFGYAAAGLESDVVYGILTANAAMSDNVALFHATHKNLGTAGAPSVTTLGEFRKLMRKQKGLNGLRPLNLSLKYLIGPAALETLFEQLCVLVTQPNQDTSTNPFKGKLTPIIEPRLDDNSATAYYGACEPGQSDTVEYAYLEGQEGVYTEIVQGVETDGLLIKARLDFAAKALDFRSLVKNTG